MMSASIPQFNLADMTAQQLADEMIRRIPAYTSEYFNPQLGDPGRTIIDLVAWMGETILYRVNLLPRRQRLEFLRLLGLQLRAAEPARGLVTLAHKKTTGVAPNFVAEGARLTGPVVFETRGPVTVQPFTGQVYYKRRLEDAEASALTDVINDLAELYGVETAEPYATTPLFENGTATIAGIDPFADSVDQTVWIALLALDETDAAKDMARAAFDVQPALLNIGVIPKLGSTAPDIDEAAAQEQLYFDWAITSTNQVGNLVQDSFLSLQTQADQTRHLSVEGTLRLVLPGAVNVAVPANDLTQDLNAGLGDKPPRIDDSDIAQRLIGWLRLRPRDSGGSLAASLPLSWLGVNAVNINARETKRRVQIGIAAGRPAQSFKLPARNIEPDTLRISVQEGGKGFVQWFRVDDLGAQGRTDRAYTLDPAEGVITLGDGLSGMMPQQGSRIRVDILRAGGGPEGNVAAGSLTRIETPDLVALQPAALSEGRAIETLEMAEKRVSAFLQHQDRCVTAEDYRAIAGTLDVARIEVLPRFRPYQQRTDVAGVVSVLPLPEKSVQQPPNPRPDRRLIDRVYAHLDARRPLGTELFVIAPDYVPIGVSIAVDIREGFAEEQVINDLRAALYAFYWPLRGGGREGTGWPMGQAVFNLETELIASRVTGVRTTSGATIFAMGAAGLQPVHRDPNTGTQSIALKPWQLPELLQLDIAVGATFPPDTLSDGTAIRGTGGTAIPVVPEVC
jgi:hypothetical protein